MVLPLIAGTQMSVYTFTFSVSRSPKVGLMDRMPNLEVLFWGGTITLFSEVSSPSHHADLPINSTGFLAPPPPPLAIFWFLFAAYPGITTMMCV